MKQRKHLAREIWESCIQSHGDSQVSSANRNDQRKTRKVFNRILLNRMKDAVGSVLRDEQAGFRTGRSCIVQITTVHIIIEQSLEWNSSLHINFVDYEKAIDGIHRPTLWKLMRYYGIPDKITNIIKNSYEGMTCRVVHGGQLTDAFQVRTGLFDVAFPDSSCHWLDNEKINWRREKWYPVVALGTTRWLVFCWWPRSALSYTTADAGQDR